MAGGGYGRPTPWIASGIFALVTLTSGCGGRAVVRVDAVGDTAVSTTSTTTSTTPQQDFHPDMKITTPSVPRGGVMRVEGTTCGDSISVSVGASFPSAGDGVFRGSYIVTGDLTTPRPFALGVSVPTAVAPGDYPVDITCWSGDAGGPPSVRSVTVTPDEVDPVVTAVSGPSDGRVGSSVHLVGSGCRSGGITAGQARILIETSSGFVGEREEHFAAVGADGEFASDAVLPRLLNPELFPRWFVTAYCVRPDGMNYGAASTEIELAPAAPTTTMASELPHTN